MCQRVDRATHVLILALLCVPSGTGRQLCAEEEPAVPQMGELPDIPNLEAGSRKREEAERAGKPPAPVRKEQAQSQNPEDPVPAGTRPLRPTETLGSNRRTGEIPGGGVRLFRLHHNGKDWDRNFGADGDWQMLLQFHKRTNIPIARKCEAITIKELAGFPKVFTPHFVYVTGEKPFSVDEAEAKTLREYLLERGGFLIGDSPGEHFSGSLRGVVAKVLGRDYKWSDIPNDDEIYTCYYILPKGAPPLWHHDGARPLGIKAKGRWIVFYHPGHMSDAWKKGHSGASKETAEAAYRLGANLIHYAYTHYMDFLKRAEN